MELLKFTSAGTLTYSDLLGQGELSDYQLVVKVLISHSSDAPCTLCCCVFSCLIVTSLFWV